MPDGLSWITAVARTAEAKRNQATAISHIESNLVRAAFSRWEFSQKALSIGGRAWL